jgi:2-hydroxycyclohexanecarboxyl-CoA dehydrogenase
MQSQLLHDVDAKHTNIKTLGEKNMQNFKNKTVIVTGGAGGIGGATCRRFAAEGAKVAVFDMNLDAAIKVADDIKASGGTASAFKCDITDRAAVDTAVTTAISQLGPIDVLVNNAGWDVFKPFLKTVPDEWSKLIAINLTGALHMLHAVLPGMVERNTGRIVNVASDAAPRWFIWRGCVFGMQRRFGCLIKNIGERACTAQHHG